MNCFEKTKNVQHKVSWWKVENEWVKSLEICFKICWLKNFKCGIVHRWCWCWSRGKDWTRIPRTKGSGLTSQSRYWSWMLAKAWTNACVGFDNRKNISHQQIQFITPSYHQLNSAQAIKIYTISRTFFGTPCLLRDKLWLQKSFKRPVSSPFQLEHSSGQSSTPSGPRILCRVCECGGSINTDL